MAITLKPGKSHTPVINSTYGILVENSAYYGVIDDIQYDKADKRCSFSVNIYGNSSARADNKAVVDRLNFHYNNDGFDSLMGNNGLTISDAYIKALEDERLTNWQSDE